MSRTRISGTPSCASITVHVDYVFNEADDDANAVIFTTGQWYFQDKEIADNPDGLAADTLGVYRTSIEDPLTWGVDLRYSF